MASIAELAREHEVRPHARRRLVGVDLLPDAAGRYVVLELNGAVDFDERCALGGCDVYSEVWRALQPAVRSS